MRMRKKLQEIKQQLRARQRASAVAVNVQTIGFLERGDHSPSLELAFRIADVFKLPLEAVFSPRPFRLLSEQVYEIRREA